MNQTITAEKMLKFSQLSLLVHFQLAIKELSWLKKKMSFTKTLCSFCMAVRQGQGWGLEEEEWRLFLYL